MTIPCLILAAGAASRFGGPKQLAPFGGHSLVVRAVRASLQAGLDPIVVVGAYAEEVKAELLQGIGAGSVAVAENPLWKEGMGSSVAAGMRAVLQGDPGAAAVLILLADQVRVDAPVLSTLIDQHRRQPRAPIASRYGDDAGSWGPPCLFPSDCFAELVSLGGERGAKSVLQRHRDRLIELSLPQAAYDVDTREDLERIVRGPAAGA